MTSVCSSDDSATILSVHTSIEPSKLTKAEWLVFMETNICLHTLSSFCKYYCMKDSIKSTIGMFDYVEFNSEFIFKNTIAVPIIKYIAACTNLSESESFSMRGFENYNLISDLTGSGFPSYNSNMCQYAQALLHYRTIGSHTNPLFSEFVFHISEYPDLTHGFFLIDHELITGVLGLSFSRWIAVKENNRLLYSIKQKNYSEMEVGPDGSIIDSLNMKHGHLYRWYKLLDRISTGVLVKDSLIAKDVLIQEKKQ